jgi:hypothetical protein
MARPKRRIPKLRLEHRTSRALANLLSDAIHRKVNKHAVS